MSRIGRAVASGLVLASSLVGCAGERGREADSSQSSLSVPQPAEEVALTAPVRSILGPHALEVGDVPTVVIVVQRVPRSLRPGTEVQATGSVRVCREGLGVELGISLSDAALERLAGRECLVATRVVVLP